MFKKKLQSEMKFQCNEIGSCAQLKFSCIQYENIISHCQLSHGTFAIDIVFHHIDTGLGDVVGKKKKKQNRACITQLKNSKLRWEETWKEGQKTIRNTKSSKVFDKRMKSWHQNWNCGIDERIGKKSKFLFDLFSGLRAIVKQNDYGKNTNSTSNSSCNGINRTKWPFPIIRLSTTLFSYLFIFPNQFRLCV